MRPCFQSAIRWSLNYGKHYEFLSDLQAEGDVVPALDNMPRPDALQGVIISAFWQVCGSRPASFGSIPHPLSIETIDHWWERGGFRDMGFNWFEFLEKIQLCDAAYREESEKINKADQKKAQ